MAEDSKDTIYIDVDEEITGIISKIQNSPKDIVALVLPKRASVLQSSVNMKLLKRAQDQHKKKVVLITSESRILPLAGAAGLFVASNLTSKPYVPLAKVVKDAKPDAEDGIDPNTPVSQVAPEAKFADSDDEIEIDNTPKTPAAGAAAAGPKRPKKDKKSKVPNFSKFRKKVLAIAIIVFLLIFGLIYGLLFAPRAKVIVKAQTDSLPTSFDFIADPNASGVDTTGKIVRASTQTTQKDSSEQVNSSGTENKGKKASGSLTMTARKCGGNPFTAPSSVSSGKEVSSNGVTYITQESAKFTTSGAQPDSQPNCYIYPATNDVSITAQSGGANGNVSNANFSVAGRNDVSAQGSASGGTDNNVKVVTQADVDKAKERISGAPSTAKDDFKAQLEKDGYIAIDDSFKADPGKYSITPGVGKEGDQVTVSVTTTYTMLGIKKEDLQELIKNNIASQEQGKGKTILSDGIDNATIKVNGGAVGLSDGQAALNINTTVVVGPDINQDSLKQQIAGKKAGEARDILGQVSGITDPEVDLSPFWVGRVPKSNSKITIEIQQADGSSIP